MFNSKYKILITVIVSILVISFGCLSFAWSASPDQKTSNGFVLDLLSAKKDFKLSEEPQFEFSFTKQYNSWAKLFVFLRSLFVDDYKDIKVKAIIRDAYGQEIKGINSQMRYIGKGKFLLNLLNNSPQLRPGKYFVEIIVNGQITGNKKIKFQEDFTWGVLAFNANKSIYSTGEDAFLQMAVLNDLGHTICDANLYLEIIAPDGGVAYLNTDNNLIVRNPKCGPDNVIEDPDYYAYYRVGPEGIYQVKLRAETENGVRIINDYFVVKNDIPFVIERIGPTRIKPTANYEMAIKIKANKDFNGAIKEFIPSSFKLVDWHSSIPLSLEMSSKGERQELIWKNANLSTGDSIEISYVFDAPEISPEFYLLGPVQIGDFSEVRLWQIASDDIAVYEATNGYSVLWTNDSYAWDTTDDTYAYRDIPRRSVDDSANYLLGSSNNSSAIANTIIDSVEIGIEGYVEDTVDVSAFLVPVFNGTATGTAQAIDGATLGAADDDTTDYVDITNDALAPSTWTWNDIANLDVKVYGLNDDWAQAKLLYVDQIRIRVTYTVNNKPTSTIVSAIERTDGTGVADISIEVSDLDGDDAMAKVEFATGTACDFSSSSVATIDETDANTTAIYGDPNVDNTNEYQIGNSLGWIVTASGTNTVDFDWLSKTDIPNAAGYYCLRLTVNDGIADQATSATTTIYIDNAAPVISNVVFTPSSGVLKIGDTATATIYSDGTGYTAGTITINGVDVSSTLVDNGDNTYTVTYTVSEGDTDIPDANDLPVNISLKDAYNNESAAYTAADPLGRPGVDANRPVISAISIANTAYKIGDTITLVITVVSDTDTYTLGAGSTINEKPAVNLVKLSDTSYNVDYTVAEGDTDRAPGTIPISIVLIDSAGNATAPYTTLDPNTASIDAHKPEIFSVSIPSRVYKVGDVIRATTTVTADSDTYTLGTTTINNVQVTNLVKIDDSTYTFDYTVSEGDTDRAPGTIPVSVILVDSVGQSNDIPFTDVATNTASIDANSPIVANMTFVPSSGVLKIGDTATSTITASSSETGLTASIITINGVNVTASFIELGAGDYQVVYTVTEGDNDVLDSEDLPVYVVLKDAAGNESAAYTVADPAGRPGVDANRPIVYSVAFNPSSGVLKVGDTATTTITASSSETGLVAGTITINGVDVSATFTELGLGDYQVTYTVSEGDTDILDSEDLPVYITLVDAAGNESLAYTTADPANRPGVDAHTPAVASVSFSPSSGVLKVGDSATITITASSSETGLTAGTITINGVDVAATFTELGLGDYQVTYTVSEGDTDILDSEDLPVYITLKDAAGNESAAYTTPDPANRPGVDGHSPVVASVSFTPSSGVLKIGDTATTTITASSSETGLVAGTITINGVDVSATFVELGLGQYQVTYTVSEGDTDIADSADLPVYITLVDAAGNESAAYTVADPAGRPGVDAHRPIVSNVSFIPSSGVLKVGDTATTTITASSSETGLVAGTITINGVDVSATFVELGLGQYQVTYTVSEGDTDIADSADLPVYITLVDAAGNESAAYTTPDPANRPGVDAHTPAVSSVSFTPSSGVLKVGDTATITITASSSETGLTAGTITINGVDVSATFTELGLGDYQVTYTVSEGDTDILDSEDLPVYITLKDAAGNESAAYTTPDPANRPGVDGHSPTPPGALTLNTKDSTSVILNFGATTTETNFREYKIFYKVGTSGVTEVDIEFASSSDPNLGNILFNGAATTTITGLATGTTYVFNIWAYDLAGNKASASPELVVTTNYAPQTPSSLDQLNSSNVSITNGLWITEDSIKLKANALDNDTSEVLTLYFELLPAGSTFSSPTGVPTGACASATSYSACTSKIWAITSPAGDYSVTPFTGTVNPQAIPDSAVGYIWQVKVCDDSGACSAWVDAGTDPNFKVDTTPPTTPGSLTLNSQTSTSATFNFGSSTVESNFREYKIFYKIGTSSVTEADIEFASSSDPNLAYIDYNGAATTTIDSLTAGTTYVFNIWAYDLAGNKANATEIVVTTNAAAAPPSGYFNSVAQKTDGTGAVDISIEVDDPDNDDTVRAKLEYVAGSTCDFTTPLDPSLDETDANITADYGDPDIDNNSTYQIGTSTAWIWTSFGSNTVNFDWLSKLDIPNADGIYCLRLTVNDGTFDQATSATTTVLIDNVDPTAPGALSFASKTTNSVTLYFGATSTDTNFSHYKIFYKVGASGVTEADTEHTDPNLAYQDYNGAATTTISGLAAGTTYVFNIWAYDLYGNRASSTEISVTTNYIPASPTSLGQTLLDNTAINNGAWINENDIKLKASVIDNDTSEVLTLYFELLPATSIFTTATSVPASACASTTSYSACTSKIWAITSSAGDYSVTPFTGAVLPADLPDSSVGYKWQVMACDDDNVCSSWVQFNVSVPNIKVDTTPPSSPGSLSLSSYTSNSIVLSFGTSTTEANFREYKIFYKAGSGGVTQADTEFSSSSDPNLAYINYNGAATTTISGLTEGTTYVFNIWAYDLAGNIASATIELVASTNNRPSGSFVLAQEKTDGSGVVDILINVSDADGDEARARIDYVAGSSCDFTNPLDPTLDETDANATSTYGDAKIDNNLTYQIGTSTGWIITASGTNTVSFDWMSNLDIPSADGTYCLRLIVNDKIDDQLVAATTTLTVDNVAPTPPGDLTLSSRTGTSLTLAFGSSTIETNFKEYRIFYRQGTLTVTENDTEHDDSALDYINYNGQLTTTVTGLSPNTQYSFKIYAYDNYGHKSSSNQVTFVTNSPPTGSFNSVSQKTDGSGVVDISIEVYDVNGDEVRAKLEYVAGADCDFITPLDPTLDETSISADYGTPIIDNNSEYQVGTSSGMIITSLGSNTVNFDWLTKNDIPLANGVYCLRLTTNDGIDDQIVLATTTLVIDNIPPTAPGSLSIVDVSGLDVTLGLGASTVDTNFSEYKIFYKIGSAGVTETDNEFNKYNDSNLGYIDYNGATTTVVDNLSQNTQYVFNIWAYDDFGNKASATPEVSTTTLIILSATWREAEDTVDPTVSIPIGKGNNIRLRLDIANTGDWDSGNYSFRLEYGIKNTNCLDITEWLPVPTTATSEHFEMINSVYFNTQSTTTPRLSNPESYTFVTGYMVENPDNTANPINLGGANYTEIEYAFMPTIYSTPGQTYCFRVTNNGEELHVYNQYPELTLAGLPEGSFISARQKNDGSGVVDISILADYDRKEDLRAKIEYVATSTCDFTTPLDPTLDEADANITATYGDPIIDNNSEYQVGTSTGWIVTAYGANTVNFDWLTKSDFSNVDATYCLRLTVNDGYDDQAIPATTTVVIDHVNPTTPGNLTVIDITSNSVVLGLGTSSSDTNFKEYKIYYKEGSSGVTESDSVYASSSDPNLGYADYNSATTTTITGLLTNTQYVFRIWAYDEFGNKASSSEELVVTIRYLAKTENWRWYYDHYNETPVEPIAAENTAPNTITDGSIIKLRVAVREVEGIMGEDLKLRLQYSTYSDFSADVHFVGEIGSTAIWTYGDGVDDDNDPILQTVLASTTAGATHNESGISTTTYDLLGNAFVEWEFTVRNNGAPDYTTYYFRLYDNINETIIYTNTGFSYPSLVTESGSLSYTILGFNAGSVTEGVTTNIVTTPTKVPFGTLSIGTEAVGAQRFIIDTNAGMGYQLFVYQRQNLLSANGADIDPIPATNEAPAAWPLDPYPSGFGYHTGDDTLSGSSPSRFAADNTYARFEEAMKEISYSPIPVSSETVDFIFKAEITDMQEAGDYETEIVYILVPAFY